MQKAITVTTFTAALEHFERAYPTTLQDLVSGRRNSYLASEDCLPPFKKVGVHPYFREKIKDLLSAEHAFVYYVEEKNRFYALFK